MAGLSMEASTHGDILITLMAQISIMEDTLRRSVQGLPLWMAWAQNEHQASVFGLASNTYSCKLSSANICCCLPMGDCGWCKDVFRGINPKEGSETDFHDKVVHPLALVLSQGLFLSAAAHPLSWLQQVMAS